MERACNWSVKEIPLTDEQRKALINESNTNMRKFDARLEQIIFCGEPLDSFALHYKIFTNWVGSASGEPEWDPNPAWYGTRESFEKIIGKF